jgi:hypothetical protein
MGYPIKTYDDLTSAMADWLNRGDLVAQVPAFVALFEAEYNADERGRIQKSVVISTADVAGEYVPVPSDYIQMQNLRVPGSQCNPDGLDLLTPQQINWFRERYSTANEPRYYAIIGQQIQLLPIPDQQYTLEMQYFAKLPSLSTSNETNWLLNDHPNLYLYGSLKHAEPYLKNDERIATWKALYEEGMEHLKVTDDRAQASGSVLKMRTRSFG